MRAVIQRVSHAQVSVADNVVGQIGKGLLVFIGFEKQDQPSYIPEIIDKILGLRIFPNELGKFDRSVRDIAGSILLISQFTLMADCSKGRRPNFTEASPADQARALYELMSQKLLLSGVHAAFGCFQEDMQILSSNDGPVTIILDFPKKG